jgi:hypothetical protein
MAEELFECEWTPEGEIILRIKKPGLGVLTPEVRAHMLGARKEVLSALRSLIDAALDKMEQEESPRTHRTTIKVE